jgi:hypothetical protein
VLHRKVKNPRLAAVGYLWTFAALRVSTGARAHYDRRRVAGDRHTAAQRHLFNRFLGCLYDCLQPMAYAEDTAAVPCSVGAQRHVATDWLAVYRQNGLKPQASACRPRSQCRCQKSRS